MSLLDSSSYASFQSSDIGREISVSAFRLAVGSPVEDCDWPSRSGSLLLALSTEDVASLLFAALVPVLAETGLEDVDEEKAFAAFDLNQDVLDPGAAGFCLLCRPTWLPYSYGVVTIWTVCPLESSRVRAIERLARELRC